MGLLDKLKRLCQHVRGQGVHAVFEWALTWIYWQGRVFSVLPPRQVQRLLSLRLMPRRRRPICTDVEAWCETHAGTVCTVFLESTLVSRKPPQTIEPEVQPEYLKRLQDRLPERYLARLPKAKVVGENGLVVLPDGQYAVEPVYTVFHLTTDPCYYDYFLPMPQTRKEGHYFSLVAIWANQNNYYHWIHDALLRLYLVIDQLPEDVRFLIHGYPRPYHYESLGLLGIRESQICHFTGDEVWELESLYFAPPAAFSGLDRPAADQWLREQFLAACNINAPHKRRRIYISRRLAGSRRVLNELEVERCLKAHGFETITAETMSFRDEVVLFAEAECIVSPHGAGLTNMLFAPPGIGVLEIADPSWRFSSAFVYWAMSEALGHNYWYFFGEVISQPTGAHDLFVPIEKLQITLERMLAA